MNWKAPETVPEEESETDSYDGNFNEDTYRLDRLHRRQRNILQQINLMENDEVYQRQLRENDSRELMNDLRELEEEVLAINSDLDSDVCEPMSPVMTFRDIHPTPPNSPTSPVVIRRSRAVRGLSRIIPTVQERLQNLEEREEDDQIRDSHREIWANALEEQRQIDMINNLPPYPQIVENAINSVLNDMNIQDPDRDWNDIFRQHLYDEYYKDDKDDLLR